MLFNLLTLNITTKPWQKKYQRFIGNPSHRAFGYCSCKQDSKERHWGQQFCQMERDISVRPTERNDQTSQSGPPSKVFPNIPVGPKWNGPFHLISNRKFRNFELNEKHPVIRLQRRNSNRINLLTTIQYVHLTNKDLLHFNFQGHAKEKRL